jgi:hypothetical protein
MSLTSFIARKDVRAKCGGIRPKFPRKIPSPILVPPKTKNGSIIGTAFDYLLRIEIKRRAPWADGSHWVADNVVMVAELYRGSELDRERLRLRFNADPDSVFDRIQETAIRATGAARQDYSAYCTLPEPNARQTEQMAKHALRLAHLDVVFRAGAGAIGRDFFDEPNPDDAQDLLALLAIVPFGTLTGEKPLLLNPTFGDSSRMIGGADADIIVGQTLIDVKATKNGSCDSSMLDQLLGYFLLARNERKTPQSFPLIERFGIYFARYGYLLALTPEQWTCHPDFDATEAWFIETAMASRAKPIR